MPQYNVGAPGQAYRNDPRTRPRQFAAKSNKYNRLTGSLNTPPSTRRGSVAPRTMSGTDPNYGVLAGNNQPLQQEGLGSTAEQSASVANAQGTSTPEAQMNTLRQEQGLEPIQYGPYASPASTAVSGTDQLRKQREITRNDATSLMSDVDRMAMNTAAGTSGDFSQPGVNPSGSEAYTGDQGTDAILGLESFADSEAGQSMLERINTLTDKLSSGELSAEESAKVQGDVDATKAQYDQLIQQANLQKEQGMAKNLVAAGQRGGLMNTQFAGVAALMPTVGGNFVGTGGELNRIKSEYDLNIQNLQAQRIQAMTDARSAAEEAIRSNRVEDLSAAREAYDLAKSINDEHNQMVKDKVAAIQAYQEKQATLAAATKKDAQETMKNLAAVGYTIDDIPESYFEDIDRQMGGNPGTAKLLFQVAEKEESVKSQKDALDQAEKLTNVLTKIPVGKTVSIGGVDYMSLQKGETQAFSSDDGEGNTTITTVNKDTGEYSSFVLQGVSKRDGDEFMVRNGVGAFVNKRTGEIRTVTDSSQFNNGLPTNTGIYAKFPDGTYGNQCAVFCENTTTFKGPMDDKGHTYKSKMSHTDPNISIENGNVTPGMIAVLNKGAYGHVATVLGVSTVNGVTKVKVMDSNWAGDERTKVHEFNADEIGGFIPAEFEPEYGFGSGGTTKPQGGQEDDALSRFLAPEGEEAKTPTIKEINGKTMQWDSATGTWISPTGSGTSEESDTAALESLKDKIKLIQSIKTHQGLNNAVGSAKLFQRSNVLGIGKSKTLDFISRVEQLTNQDTLDQIISLKTKGGSLGALSDSEGKLLKDAANRINSFKIEKDGRVIGYKIGESEFKQALADVEELTQRALSKLQGSSVAPSTSGTSGTSYRYSDPNDPEIAQAKAAGWIVQNQPDGSVTIISP